MLHCGYQLGGRRLKIVLAKPAELRIVAESVLFHQRLGAVLAVTDVGIDFQRLLTHHPMVDAVVEMLGKAPLEDRKAHSRKRGNVGNTLCPLVVVEDKGPEVILRLNHPLEEIGLLGRRIEHLEKHEELGHLQTMEPFAGLELRNIEHIGQQSLDSRMERQYGHGIGWNFGTISRLGAEDIGVADFGTEFERKDDDLSLLMGRHHILFTARQAGTLLRGHEFRPLRLADVQRTGAHKKNPDHAARREGDTFAR